ncbi:MAG: hypothetical protein NW237_00265 [Cyanobacteriota bacterium]|nr:hypothetical protein [Cyanobacteriota bacterium]
MSSQPVNRKKLLDQRSRLVLFYEQIMALVALANLCLILFDSSYIAWRDFWLQGKIQLFGGFGDPIALPILSEETHTSPITQLYDPVKGIEPNPDTQRYLQFVDQLEAEILRSGITSELSQELLAQLRNLSQEMIDTDPFQLAGKSGVLAKIQNRMRDHIPNQATGKAAFSTFWTADYLSRVPEQEGLSFFQEEIRPLLELNYNRPIGESGSYIDFFPALDFPFVALFGLELLLRTLMISRRFTGVSWLDAVLWRWYDLLFLLPFWRWLRIIPVVIRLGDARLIDLARVRSQMSQGFVTNFAEDLTEVVVIRVINQIQGSIQRGNFGLLPSGKKSADSPQKSTHKNQNFTYIDLNNINEIEAIATIFIKMILYKVLPKVQPDVEALLRYNLDTIFKQLPGYEGLTALGIPEQFGQRLASEITQSVYQSLTKSFEDPVGNQLTAQLSQHFMTALMSELKERRSLEEIRQLLYVFLEEIKLNYVERLSQEDLEEVMEQTRRIRQQAQSIDPS